MSIWGLSWPWKTKKGRTVKSYNKKGHVRVLCANSRLPVTGEIEFRNAEWTLAWFGQPVVCAKWMA